MSNDVIIVEEEDCEENITIKYELVCSVCTSPRTVYPFPLWARDWLAAVCGRALESGVCALCAPWLRRSVQFWERARRAQATLMHLRDSGQLTISRMKKLNSTIQQPFVQLTTQHFGPYDHEHIKVSGDSLPNDLLVIEDKDLNKTEIIKTEDDEYYNVEYLNDNDFEFKTMFEFDDNLDSNNDIETMSENDNNDLKYENSGTTTKVKQNSSDSEDDEVISNNDSECEIDETEIVDEIFGTRNSDRNKRIQAKLQTVLEKKPIKKPTDELLKKHFNINYYTVKEQKADALKEKMTDDYLNSTFKCETCVVGFTDQVQYKKHVAEHTKTGKICPVCLRRYMMHIFCHHMRYHLGRWTFNCKHCPYSTHQLNLAKTHAAWHDGKKIECRLCGEKYSSVKTYAHHKAKAHADRACNLCGHSFVGDNGLRHHRILKHKGEDVTTLEDGPQCVECDIRFNTDVALETHLCVSRRHKPQPAIRKKRRMELHRRRPRATRRLHCDQCGIEIVGLLAYHNHFAKHHPTAPRPSNLYLKQPSLCNVCGCYAVNMTDHMQKHASVVKHCPEPGCSKTFRSQQCLYQHLNTHREPRHMCPTCGKLFNNRSNMVRHSRYTHSSVRDVKCDYCDKYFKSIHERYNHTYYVHLKNPWPRSNKAKRGGRGGKEAAMKMVQLNSKKGA